MVKYKTSGEDQKAAGGVTLPTEWSELLRCQTAVTEGAVLPYWLLSSV